MSFFMRQMHLRGLMSRLFFALAAIALVNAPFWWLSQSIFMSRALVSLDSIVAVMVISVAPLIGCILLLVSWVLDWTVGQSHTFHFADPLEFIKSVRFASTLNWWVWLEGLRFSIAVPFLASFLALRFLVWRRPAIGPVIAGFAVAIAIVEVLNGSSILARRDRWIVPYNIAGSPSLNILQSMPTWGTGFPAMRELSTAKSLQGLIDIPAWAASNPDGSILLVIVESLGVPVQPLLRSWLYSNVSASTFDVRADEVPFRGSTTSGELRTLCGLAGPYAGIDSTTGRRCLPAKLANMGWQTAGMHGFARDMFDRKYWWPHIGLQQQLFVDSVEMATGPRCGRMFFGTCDDWLVAYALEWIQPSKRFAYVLTLNTHLPLAPVQVPADLASLCMETHTLPEVCELTAELGALLRTTSMQASIVRKRPLLLIVGDHAPPFNDLSARASFRSDVVPAFVLMPR